MYAEESVNPDTSNRASCPACLPERCAMAEQKGLRGWDWKSIGSSAPNIAEPAGLVRGKRKGIQNERGT